MALKKARTFLDTTVSGLVIAVEHNLNGTPDVFFTEVILGNEVYVSLLDARIAEVKTLDANNIQVTFASTFAGYFAMVFAEVDNPSDHQRLLDVEDRVNDQFNLIEDKVSKDQWIQMNTLLSSQISSLQTQVDDLQSQVNTLRTDVDALDAV